LAWVIKKVKMQQRNEREEDFSDYGPAEKSVHFFGKKYCVKMHGKEQRRKEKQKRVNCKN
jgi:hypothetical protein